jgi:hypothetical protein
MGVVYSLRTVLKPTGRFAEYPNLRQRRAIGGLLSVTLITSHLAS